MKTSNYILTFYIYLPKDLELSAQIKDDFEYWCVRKSIPREIDSIEISDEGFLRDYKYANKAKEVYFDERKYFLRLKDSLQSLIAKNSSETIPSPSRFISNPEDFFDKLQAEENEMISLDRIARKIHSIKRKNRDLRPIDIFELIKPDLKNARNNLNAQIKQLSISRASTAKLNSINSENIIINNHNALSLTLKLTSNNPMGFDINKFSKFFKIRVCNRLKMKGLERYEKKRMERIAKFFSKSFHYSKKKNTVFFPDFAINAQIIHEPYTTENLNNS